MNSGKVQTVVIICGGLDISVGSQAGLASVTSAMVFTSAGSNALVGMAASIAIGVLIGIINGVIIVYGRVNATIATLAGLAAYKGVAQLVSNGAAQGYVLNNSIFVFLSRVRNKMPRPKHAGNTATTPVSRNAPRRPERVRAMSRSTGRVMARTPAKSPSCQLRLGLPTSPL